MAHRGPKVPDSDDEFSAVAFPQEILKKSKLSKKKNKNKENVKKPHTSTQMEVPETLTTRGGRPARKTAEELEFQKQLEEALKLSSEEVSSSSAEIVSVQSKDEPGVDLKEKALTSDKVTVKDFDEILIVSDSQESVEPVQEIRAVKEDPVKDVKGNIREDSEDENIVATKRKGRVIDSEDEFEKEVVNNEIEKRLPELPQTVPSSAKNSASSKKRKVDESWVVTDDSKKPNKGLRTTLKRTPKPIKKYTGVSSDEDSPDEDNDFGDESSDGEEFLPVKAKIKTPVKKNKKTSDNLKLPISLSPKNPLKSLNSNSIKSPSIPLPKSKNMFQNKSPIRHVVNPRSPFKHSLAQKSLTPGPQSNLIKHALPPKSLTPGPSTHSISALLKKFQNQTKSSPLVRGHTKATPPTPSTPLQRKIPGWNPPSKIGTDGSGNSTPGPSPSTGLRVGLSRNFKAKPLHSGVKYP